MSRLLPLVLLLSPGAAGQGSMSKETTITLRRTCLGTCPEYKLTIRGDGSVVYEGKHYVHATGFRKGKISSSAVHALVQKFQDANFFEMSGGGIVIDAPVRTVSVDMNGRHKELKEGCACPPELVRLEDEVGKTAGSERWVRGRLRVFLHWPGMRS